MIKDPKTLIDMGCNVSTMMAFAMKEGTKIAGMTGPEVAAAIAAGQMLFDIVFQLPDRVDPQSLSPTRADLSAALDSLKKDLKKEIGDSAFETTMDDHVATILSVRDQLDLVWVENAVTDRAKRGPLFQSNVTSAQYDSWKSQIDAYQTAIVAVPNDILKAVNWIEGEIAHARRTLGFYTLAGGLWTALCRLNIAFEYVVATHDYTDKKRAYDDDYAKASLALNAWKLIGDSTKPKPTLPVEPLKPEDDDNFFNGSVFASEAYTQIKRFIKYAQPHIEALRKDYGNLQKDLHDRLALITLVSSGSKYHFQDTATGKTSAPTAMQALADGQMQMYKGTIQAAMFDRLVQKYNLDKFTEDDIATLEKTLAEWKKTETLFSPL